MGSGASAEGKPGVEGKTAKVASPNWEAALSAKVTKDEAKAFCGDSFDEAAFDAAAKDGTIDKIDFLLDTCLIKVASNDDGLLPQPAEPKKRLCVVQIYVKGHEFGGTDKSCNGHRYDSIPFANGCINAGMSCPLIHYVPEQHDTFFKVMENMDALIVRCNPGQIKAAGGDQGKFDDAVRKLKTDKKVPAWPSPDVMEFMGAKDALTKIRNMNIGMPDTGTYFEADEFAAGFKKSMAFGRRVVKQNRGSSGEGIWIISLKSGEYCKEYGEKSCEDSDELILMEANDNHVENHTVGEFIEWCLNGRTDKSGTWESKGTGKYLEGGKAAGGQITDQGFCGRILEGELRFNMVNDVCLGVIHKVPAPGGMSAVGGTGSVYKFYDNNTLAPDGKLKEGIDGFVSTGVKETFFVNKEPSADGNRHRVAPEDGPKKVEEGVCVEETITVNLQALLDKFVKEDCPKLMATLELPDEPIPLWWTADFINGSKGECWKPAEGAEKWVVGEFNCSCVGISKCLAAYCKPDTPNVSWKDIPAGEAADATTYGNIVGKEAAKMLGVA